MLESDMALFFVSYWNHYKWVARRLERWGMWGSERFVMHNELSFLSLYGCIWEGGRRSGRLSWQQGERDWCWIVLYALSHTCAQPVIGQYLYSEMYVNFIMYTVPTHLSGLGMAKRTHHPLGTCNISQKCEEMILFLFFNCRPFRVLLCGCSWYSRVLELYIRQLIWKEIISYTVDLKVC